MGVETKTSPDSELNRLKKALRENEDLMREAAIKYEDLVAVKEDLSAAIQAREELKKQSQSGS